MISGWPVGAHSKISCPAASNAALVIASPREMGGWIVCLPSWSPMIPIRSERFGGVIVLERQGIGTHFGSSVHGKEWEERTAEQ